MINRLKAVKNAEDYINDYIKNNYNKHYQDVIELIEKSIIKHSKEGSFLCRVEIGMDSKSYYFYGDKLLDQVVEELQKNGFSTSVKKDWHIENGIKTSIVHIKWI